MNSDRSQFMQGFVSFFKNVLPLMPDSDAASMALQTFSEKIGQWASSLLGFYFAAVVGIAATSVKAKTKLRPVFQFLYLSILLGFFCLLLAEFARFNSTFPNQLLRCLNLVFLTLAFSLAISIPFPLYFKLVSFVSFLAAVLLIVWLAIIPTT